jgi:hypothetical protein
MTVIPVDRTDSQMLDKIELLFSYYGVDSTQTFSHAYCQKHGLTRWLPHFYSPRELKADKHSPDGTDKVALLEAEKLNRFAAYMENIAARKPEFLSDTVLNCYRDQQRDANRPGTPNGF